MKTAILFDLGNTMVRYFLKTEFPGILAQGIAEVESRLREAGLLRVSPDVVRQGVDAEDYESADGRVRPLAERLGRIFQLDANLPPALLPDLCHSFLKPFFASARRYDDTLPTLDEFRRRGVKTALVSNLPWGSPAQSWHEEVARQDLSPRLDAVVFCSDVGWRKPAPPIFEYVLDRLQVRPEQCLFVGDNPRWDVAGPRALGIDAVLIDRHGLATAPGEAPIRELGELWDRVQLVEGGKSRR